MSTTPIVPGTRGIVRPSSTRPLPARAALKTGVPLVLMAILAATPLWSQPPAASEPPVEATEPAPSSSPAAAGSTQAALPEPPSGLAIVVGEPATVMVWNRPVATLRASYNRATAAQRAAAAQARIEALPLHALTGKIESQRVSDGQLSGELISVGGTIILGVLETDVDTAAGESVDQAVATAVSQLRAVFDARLEQRRPTVILRAAGFAVASLALLTAAMVASLRLRRRAFARFDRIAQRALPVAGIDLWPFVMGLARGTRGARQDARCRAPR